MIKLAESTYDVHVHAAATKECGKNRGNSTGWNAEKRYRTACTSLIYGYIKDDGIIVPALRKRFRHPSPRWPGNK